MRFRGGHNVLLQGRPKSVVKLMPEPKVLYLPLRTKRFHFSQLCVEEGERVSPGDVLAKDPDHYEVPLLAPRAGQVRLSAKPDHIVLDDLAKLAEHADIDDDDVTHVRREFGVTGVKRHQMLALGAWEFMFDAHTGALPDPLGTPQAVIVSTMNLEPFSARGDAQLHTRLLNFTRGLEQLQTLLEYQPIYLLLPDIRSDFANLVRNHIRGYASVRMIEVPLVYPHDDFALIARKLRLSPEKGPVWATRTEGVLAIDRALTLTMPCLVRILSVGGIGVVSPVHVNVMVGYPIKDIVDKYAFEPNARFLDGGVFTGKMLGPESLGVGSESRGITVIPELGDREFLGFARPGISRSSYSACFVSSLRRPFQERVATGVLGEPRPCIGCNYCAEVCPARIMPYLIHKYLYADLIEEAERARVDLCVRCGLCSYVCPSKIELAEELAKAQDTIQQEKIALEQERLKQLEREKEEELRRQQAPEEKIL